jgi:hypothetical protein
MGFDQIVKIVIEQTAPVALAVFSMWMLNRTWEARIEEARRYAGELSELRRETLEALKQNTAAVTRLCSEMNHQDK